MAKLDDAEKRRREIFGLFRSPAFVSGEKLLFDTSISARVKGQAVRSGFANERGRLRKDLSPLERIVVRMRIETTGDAYDHEWWAAWASTPEWYKKFHEVMLESWLFYPLDATKLDPWKLGDKIRCELEFKRRKFERAIVDPEYVERWKLAEYGPPEPVELPPELRNEKVVYRYAIGGFTDWAEYAGLAVRKLKALEREVFRYLPQLREDFARFTAGMSHGAKRAQDIDLDEELLGTDEREKVLRILETNYEVIAQFRNRREITDFIVARLPLERQSFLKNEAQRKAFIERLRHTYFTKIGLGPAARGMPRKSEKITPRRSRLLIYTPDIASGDEPRTNPI
jgi:hypothetical protein